MVRIREEWLTDDLRAKINRKSVCLVRMDELVMAFDQLPTPEIVGQAIVDLLRKDQLPDTILPYLDVILRADWEWDQTVSSPSAHTFEKGGTRMTAVADSYPLFMTGLPVMRGH